MTEFHDNFSAAGDKLGYLVPQFPGQTHIFFWREVTELENQGVDVTLFSTRPPPPGLVAHSWSKDAMARTTYLGKVNVRDALRAIRRVPWREILTEFRLDGKSVLKDVLICLSAATALVRDCRKAGIEHVHVHSCGRAALIAALARHMGGPTYSVTLHGPMSDYGSGQHFKWRHAAFATIITQKLLGEACAELGRDMPERVVIQPMGVNVDHFTRETPYVPRRTGEPLRLFACGRLNVVKGHQDLLSAVRLLIDRGVDVRLEIAGEDDAGGDGYHHELQAHLTALRLGDHAKLLGAIDADDVLARLRAAHVFVLASWHEPLGVAYMEAMSCGVPTIGTRAGGVEELIRDGIDGVLVAPKDPDELATAIQTLAGDAELCAHLSAQGRKRVVEGFSSRQGAETLIAQMRAVTASE